MKRIALTSIAILALWLAIDAVSHRALLQHLYAASPAIWRPVNELSTGLVAVATLMLLFVFVAGFVLLVRPKSFKTGLCFGGLLGLALGTASGLGTYIHSPVSPALAASWFFLGIGKGLVAGGVLGRVLQEHSSEA